MKLTHLFRFIVALCISCAAGAALSHSDEFFDSKPSPHGGQVRMSGAYHLELLVEPGSVTVFVTDHGDTPISTDGASALAVIDSANGKARINLAPAGGNVLKGQGEFAADPRMRVKLTVTMAGAKAVTARFVPLKQKAAAAKP